MNYSRLIGALTFGLGLYTITKAQDDDWRAIGVLQLGIGVLALSKCSSELLPAPPDSAFNKRALSAGTAVELEHTSSRAAAKRIAKHHLLEDPDYYEKLATIHAD